jgi:signal transduction histidine kinase
MTRAQPDRQAETATSAVSLHELLRIVAHDVRSPLHTILMASDLLEARSPAESDLQRPVDIIRAAVRQIDQLVEDVLASAVPAERRTADREGSDARQLLDETVAQHCGLAELQGVLLEAEPPGPVRAAVARGPLLRALSNLVVNAITHTPEGGTVRLVARQMGADIAFMVTDTGNGIEAADLGRLLAPGAGDVTPPGRTGHGLAIVHGIVRSAGGRLSAVSQPGRGSTFTIWVPAAHPAGSVPPPPARQPPGPVAWQRSSPGSR